MGKGVLFESTETTGKCCANKHAVSLIGKCFFKNGTEKKIEGEKRKVRKIPMF